MLDALEEKRQILVNKIHGLQLKDPKSYLQLSKEIGLNAITFSHFIKGKKATSIKSLSMIEKYLKD